MKYEVWVSIVRIHIFIRMFFAGVISSVILWRSFRQKWKMMIFIDIILTSIPYTPSYNHMEKVDFLYCEVEALNGINFNHVLG